MELTNKHVEVMKLIEGGATIWGYVEAKLLREVQSYDEDLIDIVDLKDLEGIVGEKFDGAKQLPYFGAILTKKGRKFIKEFYI